jgi:nitrile hydratase
MKHVDQLDLDNVAPHPAELVDARPDEELPDPTIESLRIAEGRQAPPDANEGLLDDVSCSLPISDDQAGNRIEAADRESGKLPEGLAIAALRPDHQICVHQRAPLAGRHLPFTPYVVPGLRPVPDSATGFARAFAFGSRIAASPTIRDTTGDAMPHGDAEQDHHDDDVAEHRDHDAPLSEVELRVRTLESLLVDKGLVEPAALDAIIDRYETRVGPRNGARIVARAWVDPDFRRRLLADGTAAAAEHGYEGRQTEKLVVLENTPRVHNLVVCTLCSCYPWAVLGLPPVWYKSAPYRSRAVIDPRGVLDELGTRIPEDREVRVWDSTAEIRYMVLPERPAGTEGLSEADLADLVTRDSMIGVAVVQAPARPQ